MIINNFLVCDDIRFEVGGKHSLIGIYDESIQFMPIPANQKQWPKGLKLGIYALINFEAKDKKRNIESFTLKTDYNGSIKEIVNGKLPQDKIFLDKKLNIAIVIDRFLFEGPGEIKFILEFYGKTKLLESISPDYVLHISEQKSS